MPLIFERIFHKCYVHNLYCPIYNFHSPNFTENTCPSVLQMFMYNLLIVTLFFPSSSSYILLQHLILQNIAFVLSTPFSLAYQSKKKKNHFSTQSLGMQAIPNLIINLQFIYLVRCSASTNFIFKDMHVAFQSLSLDLSPLQRPGPIVQLSNKHFHLLFHLLILLTPHVPYQTSPSLPRFSSCSCSDFFFQRFHLSK